MTPAITDIESEYLVLPTNTSDRPDLDTAEELAVRSLLLGIVHRSLAAYAPARAFLLDAQKRSAGGDVSSWVGGISCYELAVLDLKEAEAKAPDMEEEEALEMWVDVLIAATEQLDRASALCTKQMDMSSRLDSRIVMLRDEISDKAELLGFDDDDE